VAVWVGIGGYWCGGMGGYWWVRGGYGCGGMGELCGWELHGRVEGWACRLRQHPSSFCTPPNPAPNSTRRHAPPSRNRPSCRPCGCSRAWPLPSPGNPEVSFCPSKSLPRAIQPNNKPHAPSGTCTPSHTHPCSPCCGWCARRPASHICNPARKPPAHSPGLLKACRGCTEACTAPTPLRKISTHHASAKTSLLPPRAATRTRMALAHTCSYSLLRLVRLRGAPPERDRDLDTDHRGSSLSLPLRRRARRLLLSLSLVLPCAAGGVGGGVQCV